VTRRIDLRTYQGGVAEDLGALGWYCTLGAANETEAVLGYPTLSISDFFALLRRLTLWYLADDQGWWAVAWTTPLFRGGVYGLWIRRDHRQSPSGLVFILRTLDLALTEYPVLVNTCRERQVAYKTMELGYTYIGFVPALVDAGNLHLLHLTREAFDARWPRERYT